MTGVSRNTVTKHLAAGTIEPVFSTPDRPSKLDPFADNLAAWLKTEAGRSRKQRRTQSSSMPISSHSVLLVLMAGLRPFPGHVGRTPSDGSKRLVAGR